MCIYMPTVTVFVDGNQQFDGTEHPIQVGIVQWEELALSKVLSKSIVLVFGVLFGLIFNFLLFCE